MANQGFDNRPPGTRPTVGGLVGVGAGNRPTPLYQQLKDHILAKIESGEWPPQSRIPSEKALMEEFGVSKMTANRALRELTAEGVLVRIQGVGSFVAAPEKVSTLLEIRPITEEIAALGGVHSCELQLNARETASPDLALALALPAGAQVYHTVLVHSDSGRPIQIEDRYVNPAVAPDYIDQDFCATTPSRYLLDVVPLTEVEHVIEAVLPDSKTRELLQVGPNEPCLVLYRRTWSRDQVVTRSRFIHPASRYRLGGRFKPSGAARAVEA